MKNIERRIFLIEKGHFDDYLIKRRNAFKSNIVSIYQNGYLDPDYFGMKKEDLQLCERIRRCCKAQREKVEQHIRFLCNKNQYDLFFVTFTFTDQILKNTKPETRKQKIRRLLSDLEDYILNIDYGDRTEREHYHSIIAVKRNSYDKRYEKGHLKISLLDKYDMGNYDIKIIRTNEIDQKKLSRYITKLTLHSIKVQQKYISVKKGSDFQNWKKTIKEIKETARSGNQRHIEDLFDQMTAYEH